MSEYLLSLNLSSGTAKKIAGFGRLPAGWHYGRGVTPSESTISSALVLHNVMHETGFEQTDAFPGADGEIRVTAYHGPIYLELTVEPNGSLAFVCEYQDVEIANDTGLDLPQAIKNVQKFWGLIWDSSGLYIGSIMIATKGDFRASLSKTLVTEAGFPLSRRPARAVQATPYVGTLQPSIAEYRETLQSSGVLGQNPYLAIAGSSSKQV